MQASLLLDQMHLARTWPGHPDQIQDSFIQYDLGLLLKNGTKSDTGSQIWHYIYDLAQFCLLTGHNSHDWPQPKCFQIGSGIFTGEVHQTTYIFSICFSSHSLNCLQCINKQQWLEEKRKKKKGKYYTEIEIKQIHRDKTPTKLRQKKPWSKEFCCCCYACQDTFVMAKICTLVKTQMYHLKQICS